MEDTYKGLDKEGGVKERKEREGLEGGGGGGWTGGRKRRRGNGGIGI